MSGIMYHVFMICFSINSVNLYLFGDYSVAIWLTVILPLSVRSIFAIRDIRIASYQI